MAKRRPPREPQPIGDPTDPDSLYAYLLRFLAYQREKNYSETTIALRDTYLRTFIAWCVERGLHTPPEITRPILDRYVRYLFHYRKANGEPLTIRTQHTRVIPIRAYFKWLARERYILYNPASEIELPRTEHRLPKHVLTVKEAEAVLTQPDVTQPLGIRDRAMLEVLYSTGMRRMELMNLKLFDVDADRGTVMIRQGKGKKDRMVPIGDRALAWIQRYRDDVRPELVTGADDSTLFLSSLGEAFAPNRLTQLVRDYVQAADIGKTGACHLFRHTMATLMLENGADVRFIQAMLGHVSLETTQIYTQVSIRKLKEIHTATHPAKLKRARQQVDAPADDPETDRETLLQTLDAEALEDREDEAGT
jgi:integrase/recombinase XerD